MPPAEHDWQYEEFVKDSEDRRNNPAGHGTLGDIGVCRRENPPVRPSDPEQVFDIGIGRWQGAEQIYQHRLAPSGQVGFYGKSANRDAHSGGGVRNARIGKDTR